MAAPRNTTQEEDDDYLNGSDVLEFGSDAAPDDGCVHLSSTRNISVRFLRISLLRCKVQAIIISQNSKLDPSRGWAKAVLNTAGGSVWDDLKKQTGGNVQEPGTVLVTTGGALKEITHIIHIVAPVWANYDNLTGKMECLYRLQKALLTCFQSCVAKSLTSVALPAIGTGHCGIPAGLAYLVYVSALIKLDEYCHSEGVTNLRIYFVDTSQDSISAISKVYNRAFSCGYDSTADQISNEVEKDLGIKPHIISPRFMMKAYKGDISIFREGSIICAVNKDLTPSGSDAEEIAHQAGDAYTETLQIHGRGSKYKGGQVCLPVVGNLSTHLVLHAIIPSKKKWPIGRENHYREKLIACYRNALQMASDQKETVVALSILGIDTGYLKKDLCCSALMDAMTIFVDTLDEISSLKQLHVICREDDVLNRIVTLLNKFPKKT